MLEFFHNAKIDWLGKRKAFILVSIIIMIAGLVSAVSRQMIPGGTEAFNLGVDFQGGTVVTAKFRQKPTAEELRSKLQSSGISDSIIQDSLDKTDEVLIKIPLIEGEGIAESTEQSDDALANVQKAQVARGRAVVKAALDGFGKEAEGEQTLDNTPDAAYKIVGTDSVGAVAGAQLRNQAVAATLLGLVGILLYIAFRYDWTYAAGGVIAVFHDVLVVLAFFSIFQWEINLTVIAAILTIVGFSINDSIVIFDRIRENLAFSRDKTLFEISNDSINQTLSRTIITSGLVFFSVLALVIFGGEVLRSFSLALLVGVIFGTYSTIAIASPIAIWWQDKIGSVTMKTAESASDQTGLASAARGGVKRKSALR